MHREVGEGGALQVAAVDLHGVLQPEWSALIGRGTSTLCSDWLDLDVTDAIKTQLISCLLLCPYGIRKPTQRKNLLWAPLCHNDTAKWEK